MQSGFIYHPTAQCPVDGGYGRSKCEIGSKRHIGIEDYYIWSMWNVTLETCNSVHSDSVTFHKLRFG